MRIAPGNAAAGAGCPLPGTGPGARSPSEHGLKFVEEPVYNLGNAGGAP